MIKNLIRTALIGLSMIFVSVSSYADTKVQFALDWKFEGPSAPYFLAIDNGHFKAGGMDVEITGQRLIERDSQGGNRSLSFWFCRY